MCIRDRLLGLFFLSVGIGLDFGLLLAHPLQILGGVLALVLFKALAAALLVKLAGRPMRRALEAGLILSAGGEFAFVVMGQATGVGLVAPQTGQILVLIATLSMFAIPALTMLGERIGRSASRPALAAEPPAQVTTPGSSSEAVSYTHLAGVLGRKRPTYRGFNNHDGAAARIRGGSFILAS